MRLPILSLLVLVACRTSVDLPAGAQAQCQSNDDCVRGYICNPNNHLCIKSGADTTPPALVGTPIVSPARARLDTPVVITFSVNETLGETPRVGFAQDDSLQFTFDEASSNGNDYTLFYAASGNEPQSVPLSLQLTLVDLNNNPFTTELTDVVTFDFEVPTATNLRLRLIPDPTNVLRVVDIFMPTDIVGSLTSAMPGTDIDVSVDISELVLPSQVQVRAVKDADIWDLSLRGQIGGNFVFGATLPAMLGGNPIPEGTVDLEVIVTDGAGNVGTLLTVDAFTILTTPPTAPDVGTADSVTFERNPWYNNSGGPFGRFVVSGLANAAPASTYVLALSAPSTNATPLGAARADGVGSFSMDLPNIDRRQVYLISVDDAGNKSSVVQIADTIWVATLGNKASGSALENPNDLYLAPRFSPQLTQPGAALANGNMGLSTVDCSGSCAFGTGVTTTGLGYWRAERVMKTAGFSAPYSPKRGMAVAYYPPRGSVLVYGGSVDPYGASITNETWEWNGSEWKQISATQPGLRYDAAMAFDENLGRMVLFGGHDGGGACASPSLGTCNDTWSFNGASWSLLTTTGGPPPHRAAHNVVFDRKRNRLVVFGGMMAGTKRSDVWELNCTLATCAWTSHATGPSARDDAGMAYDDVGGRLIMFAGSEAYGGGGPCGDDACEDLWERNLTTWTSLNTNTGLFRRRFNLTYDASRNEMLGFGVDNLFVNQIDQTTCGRPWRLNGNNFECIQSAEVFDLRDVPESANSYAVYHPPTRDTLVMGLDLGAVEYRFAGGSEDKPAHVFVGAFGSALGGDSALIDRIDFGPASAPTAPGYLADHGAVFGNRSDGRTYGWLDDANCTPSSSEPEFFDANSAQSPNQAYDSAARMLHPDQVAPQYSCTWEYALPNGTYTILPVLGAPTFSGGQSITVEGITVSGTTTEEQPFLEIPVTVQVNDGALTITNTNAGQPDNRLAFVEIMKPSNVDSIEVNWTAGGTGESTIPSEDLLVYSPGCTITASPLTISRDSTTPPLEGEDDLAVLVGTPSTRRFELAVRSDDGNTYAPTWNQWCLTLGDQPLTPICHSFSRVLPIGGGASADFIDLTTSGRPNISQINLTVTFSDATTNFFCNNGGAVRLRVSPVQGPTAQGVALYGYSAGSWQLLANSNGAALSPAALIWQSASAVEASNLVTGASRLLGFAVAPFGVNGMRTQGAAITTDAVEIRVHYQAY